MDVLTLLKDLGVITVSAGALTLISRYAIKQYFEKRLESYRTELEKEKIQYSELHEQRGQVIAKLYEKLGEFEEDMRSLVKPFQATGEEPQDEKLKKAAESGEEFRKYFKKNRIYFSEDVCETMDKL